MEGSLHRISASRFVLSHIQFFTIGLQLTLTSIALHTALHSRNTPIRGLGHKTKRTFLLLMLSITAVYIAHSACATAFGARFLRAYGKDGGEGGELWGAVLHGGGPALLVASSATQAVVSGLGNWTLLYRCSIFYHDRLWVLVLPIALEVASIGVIIPAILTDASLDLVEKIGYYNARNLATAFICLSVAVNVIVTSLIIAKIVGWQRRLAKALQAGSSKKKKESAPRRSRRDRAGDNDARVAGVKEEEGEKEEKDGAPAPQVAFETANERGSGECRGEENQVERDELERTRDAGFNLDSYQQPEHETNGGRTRLGPEYTSIIAILVESSLPLAVMGVIHAVMMGTENDWYIVTDGLWYSLCALCPQLIIFRVMMGRAWDFHHWDGEGGGTQRGWGGGTQLSRLSFARTVDVSMISDAQN